MLKSTLKRSILSAIIVLTIWGCVNLDSDILSDDQNKIWVFVTIRYEENEGYQFYYYFGEVFEKVYNDIKYNNIEKGFLHLENIRYWDDDDKIQVYADSVDTGTITFRIQDIMKMELEKGDPLQIYPIEQIADGIVERQI